MPTVTSESESPAAPAPTARRSSRRSGGGGDNASAPYGALSRDEVAFGVLRQYVLQDDFVPKSDPDNVMAKIWVREGKEQEDDGDGVDWVKEDGFTVKKYEKFWRAEMEDLEDVIVEWGHKLPPEAKAHIPKEKFPDDDDDEEAEANKVQTKKAASKETESSAPGPGKKKRGRPKGSGGTKKPRKGSESDAVDGLPHELMKCRAEWFRALEAGRSKVVAEKDKGPKPTTPKKKKERAAETVALFLENASSGSAEASFAAEYKETTLDPAARRVVAAVDAHVAREADELRKELLKDMCAGGYVGIGVDAGGAARGKVTEEKAGEDEAAGGEKSLLII